ncbi:DUF3037 domain-containing protein [Microbispora sp. RL4-1S]|uniref:DUF3037 domain-containing protein n=1 Tax=Microbispora oryzae TaxID=2806554 RepID=A0A940WJV0_9ACTN|nr:DUF3037 domain-containing protein [Microbispora oryzae]MBP2702855.1 DUF3037 domain-containing protein [Microbispora oryzae]
MTGPVTGPTSWDVYEYAAIRVVPSAERGELVNAGVILYCQPQGYLCARVELDEDRLRALCLTVDLAAVRHALTAYELACGEEAGPLRRESPGARFRWLTAPRSTVVQAGPVHAGLTTDPAAELETLMNRLVRTART